MTSNAEIERKSIQDFERQGVFRQDEFRCPECERLRARIAELEAQHRATIERISESLCKSGVGNWRQLQELIFLEKQFPQEPQA